MAQRIPTDVISPDSDGQPMGETERHIRLTLDLIFTLRRWLAGRADAHVGGDLFIYYAEGNPRRVVCPDVFVAFGSHQGVLETYQTWKDGPFPQVVIEITSSSTRRQDEVHKPILYERLGVEEYYLFDPRFDPPEPTAAGLMAPTPPEVEGVLKRYRRAGPGLTFGLVELAAPDAALRSDLLGVDFVVRGAELRALDAATGALLLNPDEEAAARQVAEDRAQALADEVARLRARLGEDARD